jgi:pseudouridine synthase
MMRLNKFMAAAGIASRRRCDDFITDGRVTINGQVVTKLGIRVDESVDKVEFDGKPVTLVKNQIYLVMNKPTGFVTTVRDPYKRKSVLDLIPVQERIFPIGRLDYDTSGLLLLTNDGELANFLIHPRYKVEKTYQVLLDRLVKPIALYHFQNGITLDGRKTAPCKLSEIRVIDNRSFMEVIIAEGRNRQIRRMFEQLGYTVVTLHRIAFGPLRLTGLNSGEWRHLSSSEIQNLRDLKSGIKNPISN